jgi:choline/glycine/proline betaine transport protein
MQQLPRPIQKIIAHMNPPVFLGAAAVIVLFVGLGSSMPARTEAFFGAIQNFIVGQLGWFYILTATGLLVFIVWLLFSPYAKLKLGPPDSEPSFSNFAWLTMIFSAGMGTGLVFWGVAEPISHFYNAPINTTGVAEQTGAAMRYSFYHWGLHPWAIYALLGLSLGFLHFRKGLPLAPRSMLQPLIGERYNGLIGHLTDVLCTVGTLFGVATSLGLGAMQINSGVSQVFPVPISTTMQVSLILGITLVATLSVVLGLDKGISRLSRFNVILAALLLFFVAVFGPTVFILESLVSGIGAYLQNLVGTSLWINPEPGNTWQQDWTLFYWSWWISWSPFVGVFSARISRGRSVREFILGMLLIPTLATFVWLAVFGGAGIHAAGLNEFGALKAAALNQPELALHTLLEALPLTAAVGAFATILITVFFITSSDSGSFVDDMVTSGGDPNPPTPQRIFWAFSEGAVAITLLVAGGLEALRTASLTSGLPMAVLLGATAWALVKGLRRELKLTRQGTPTRPTGQALPAEAAPDPAPEDRAS